MSAVASPLPPDVAAALTAVIQEHIHDLAPTPWSQFTLEQRCEAALLIAQDALSEVQLRRTLRVADDHTIRVWRREPGFAAAVDGLRAVLAQAAFTTGIADALVRLRARDQRWRRLNAVVEQRAARWHREIADPEYDQTPPGADTGMLVQDVKVLEDGTPVHTYRVDTPLLRELRELEAAVAKELGQMAPERSLQVHVSAPLGDVLGEQDLAELRDRLTGRDRLRALGSGQPEMVVVIDDATQDARAQDEDG